MFVFFPQKYTTLSPWLCPEAAAARLCSTDSGNMTPMSSVPEAVGIIHKIQLMFPCECYLFALCCQTNLDFLLHIIIDESLWVYEVVRWVKGERVKGSTVHTAFILSPARFREHQTLYKALREELRESKILSDNERFCSNEGKKNKIIVTFYLIIQTFFLSMLRKKS